MGAPQGLELSISQGIVSQLRPTSLGKDPMIQTTAAISQGSSGGGLFDSEGRLIGLTTLYYKEGQSLNFAVPLSFVATLKNTTSNSAIARPNPSASTLPNQQCGWTLLGKYEGDSSPSNWYIDYCKITGIGRYRFAWTMSDYFQSRQAADSFSSVVTKTAYDCQLSRKSSTAYFMYQGNMAQGAVVKSYSYELKFSDFAPGSMAAHEIEAVCK